MKIAAYYRVSTKSQGEDDRYGLARQRADVAAFAERNAHEIVAEFEDVGYSGATAERPGLAALLEVEGVEAVVVPSWDRLARDTTLDGFLRYRLEQRGLTVLSATQANGIDPISKLTQTILAAVAGYERHLISQRLAGSRRVKAAQGGYAHGRPPFGFKTGNGHLVEDPNEQQTLLRMWELRDEGKTFTAIANTLNAEGRPSRNGGPWQQSSVHEIIMRDLQNLPYGQGIADDGSSVDDEREQGVLAIMRELRASRPRPSYGEVAAALNARGLTTRTGAAWRAPSVHAALTGEFRLRRARTFELIVAKRQDDDDVSELWAEYVDLTNKINEA